MPLSVFKLEKLLSLKGFIPTKYYSMDNMIIYIEIVSISDADTFLMYIPSKYNISIEKGSNVFKLKYIDIESSDNPADEFAGEPDDIDLEKKYEEVNIDISPQRKGEDTIESHLEDNYKRDITLKDVSTDDAREIKDIYRQLKRLRLCVQSVKYKIAIIYKKYMCTIKRDDSLECYSIKHYPSRNKRKLYITVDLELFYEKMDCLGTNMKTIKRELYHILDKNQLSHTRTLKKLLEEKSEIMKFSDIAYNKKQDYDKYIKELDILLETLNFSEKEKLREINTLEEHQNESCVKGLHEDIKKSKLISKLNDDINQITKIRQDVVKNIFDLNENKENTMLIVDKIMFDNTVMLEKVLRNFMELSKFN